MQMNELEELNYSGVALAFSEGNTFTTGTSDTLKCFTPEFVEYVHAVIIAGILTQKSMMITFNFYFHFFS